MLAPPAPRKVLFVIPSLAGGGAERAVSTLSQAFQAHGHEPIVATFGGPVEYPVGGRHVDLGAGWPASRIARKLAHTFLPVLPLRRLIAKEHPGAVVSFLSNVAPILAFRPLTVSVRTHYERLSFLDRIAIHTLYRLPHVLRTVVPSRGLADDLRRRGLPRVVTIPNAVDLDAVRAAIVSGGPPPFRDHIVAVGRLEPVKGYDLLLDAYAASGLADRADLVIVGEGPERDRLAARIKELGLRRAHLIGAVPNPFPYVASARFMALTSRMDVFPNVLVEGLACGTPLVAVDCPYGPREIIEDGVNGFLVPQGDPAALARTFSRLYEDDVLRDRLAAQAERSAERFSVAAILPSWLEILGI